MELECLGSILSQLCLNVRCSEEEKSLTHPVISSSDVLCQLPFWTEVTRAPVESQAASKPKSLLLLGFWFRLMRISQWFSCEPNSSNLTCSRDAKRERERAVWQRERNYLWTCCFSSFICSTAFEQQCSISIFFLSFF